MPGRRRWGEEVAIKLIKRGNLQGSEQRLTKVRREIEVLKVSLEQDSARAEPLLSRSMASNLVDQRADVSHGFSFEQIVKHPYIVRLHDVIETEKYIGIVLEYASGQSNVSNKL